MKICAGQPAHRRSSARGRGACGWAGRGVQGLRARFYFGTGGPYAACMEGALKMKEMALLHAGGMSRLKPRPAATLIGKQAFCRNGERGRRRTGNPRPGEQECASGSASLLVVVAGTAAGRAIRGQHVPPAVALPAPRKLPRQPWCP